MSERSDADKLAESILAEPCSDPNAKMLARQLLRRRDVIDRLEKTLADQQDPTRDMIEANRLAMLRIHEQGLTLIARIVKKHKASGSFMAIGAGDCMTLNKIVDAVDSFHPMYGEDWAGFPKEAVD